MSFVYLLFFRDACELLPVIATGNGVVLRGVERRRREVSLASYKPSYVLVCFEAINVKGSAPTLPSFYYLPLTLFPYPNTLIIPLYSDKHLTFLKKYTFV